VVFSESKLILMSWIFGRLHEEHEVAYKVITRNTNGLHH